MAAKRALGALLVCIAAIAIAYFLMKERMTQPQRKQQQQQQQQQEQQQPEPDPELTIQQEPLCMAQPSLAAGHRQFWNRIVRGVDGVLAYDAASVLLWLHPRCVACRCWLA